MPFQQTHYGAVSSSMKLFRQMAQGDDIITQSLNPHPRHQNATIAIGEFKSLQNLGCEPFCKWWCMPVTQTLIELRKEGHDCKAILGYVKVSQEN